MRKDSKDTALGTLFHVTWIFSAIVSVTAFLATLNGLNLHFCFNKECLEFAAETFIIPLKVLGVGVILSTLMLTIRRAQQTHRQLLLSQQQATVSNQQLIRQNEQDIANNANDFNNSFIKLLEETRKSTPFNDLIVNSEWLFFALYPNIRRGKADLDEEFKNKVLLPFISCFDQLTETIWSGKLNIYHIDSYADFIKVYNEMIKVIPCSTASNFATKDNTILLTDNSSEVKGLMRLFHDIRVLITVINSFQGWQYFSYHKSQQWLKIIQHLQKLTVEVSSINSFARKLSTEAKMDIVRWISEQPSDLANTNARKELHRFAEIRSEVHKCLLYELLIQYNQYNINQLNIIKTTFLNIDKGYEASGLFSKLHL